MINTVYIDILFLINLIVDCLIILSASLLLRKKVKNLRLSIASALGGIYSCIVFSIEINIIIGNILTFFLILLTTYIVFGYSSLKSFAKCFFAISASGFIYGGIIFFLYFFTDAGAVMAFSNGAIYIDIPVFIFLGFALLAYIAIWLLTRIIAWFNPKDVIYKLKIVLEGSEVQLKGFLDTGNFLNDPLTGSPVIVAEFDAVENLIPQNLAPYFKSGLNFENFSESIQNSNFNKRFRLINYKGLESGGMLPAFRPDKVYVTVNGREKEVSNVVIAVTDRTINNDNEYTALLSPKIL